MKAPAFWAREGALASALGPLGALYGQIVTARAKRPGLQLGVPTLCIGNPTLGGAGKTPVVRSLAQILRSEFGIEPHVITRGYGGSVSGSLRVDPQRHDAGLVGDEPLLLAREAVVWAGPDRVASARAAVAAGARILLMDDGFQNPGLAKSMSWLVVDGPAGIGNGKVFPAGPLRERFPDALERADALVMIGEDRQGLAAKTELPVLSARLIHPLEALVSLREGTTFAFAGIGRPEKFFDSLRAAGVQVVGTRAFPDHHRFTASELHDLRAVAKRNRARLVTTEKDLVRLSPADRSEIVTLSVTICWWNRPRVQALLKGLITPASER
ncbi:tetraacyldisaccharide 4'-kinase [Geminicoccus roseus]|uniref:tetraacyldisaccharide 4'-kinase n=1 Tax=Geminicoccus roseus TaxID=404900 RepID=UPI00047F1F6F|nr:tetraacyldisaccharide 4'-kinase [Geminicoccus roseus]